MTAFADLVLPDTTYLERHDVMSMLDRPISEFDGPTDSVRVPVRAAARASASRSRRCWSSSRARLKLPAFVNADGSRKFRDYPDFIVQLRDRARLRASAFSPAGAARTATSSMRRRAQSAPMGDVREEQLRLPLPLPPSYQYMRNWNQGYMEWAQRTRLRRYQRADPDPDLLGGAAAFRLAAQGAAAARRPPPEHLRERIETLLRSAAVLLPAAGSAGAPTGERYPLAAVTQRPMAMYHSWDSQNAWLRQIHAHNYLFVNPAYRERERHRRRRLDLGRVAMGQGALHGALQRGGRAGHRVDLERDRQGARRLARSRRTRTNRSAVSC